MILEVVGGGEQVKARSEGENEVFLAWDGEYRAGDLIRVSGLQSGEFYAFSPDPAIERSTLYMTREEYVYRIPFYEKKAGHNPMAFVGNRHYIFLRKVRKDELGGIRNLALNPADQHEESGAYPHASANVETRGEAVFAARNAIDGVIAPESHGEWPYASWGINRQADACWRLDFGRKVDIEEIHMYTRADFPHDNWWTRATFRFSDGSAETVDMEKKTREPHVFAIRKKGITFLTASDLIQADDPSPFPALTQMEVYGRETE